MKTFYWHTWVNGYRARIWEIPRQNNWYAKVRPDTRDSIQWFAGWDKADNDLELELKK